jgi:hypothetical protein
MGRASSAWLLGVFFLFFDASLVNLVIGLIVWKVNLWREKRRSGVKNFLAVTRMTQVRRAMGILHV